MKAAVLTAALVVGLAACGPPPSGVVVAREYDAPEMKSKRSCTTTGTGKNKHTTCKTRPVFEGAEWELTIRSGDQTSEVDVSRSAYDACAEGETYPACAGGTR